MEPASGEDDWVKQMLAEAMLGRSALPPTETAPIEAVPIETVPIETAPIETVPIETAPIETAPIETAPVEAVPIETVPIETAPIEETTDDSGDHVVAESASPIDAPAARPPLRYQVVLDDVPMQDPAPASTSRLFDRPSFDATNDPGVEEQLAEQHASEPELAVSDERSRFRGVVEWLVVLGSAVVVALLLRAFLFQAFFIPSESMEETLRVDDRVLVNKLSYRFGDVERGEVVVFRRPDDQPGEFRDLIKRVIGLPGETIEARGNTIFIDGQALIEPYLPPGEVIGDFGPVAIPDGEYFMMGDNRDNSGDSRVFGPIDGDRIIGRAFFLFWPLDRVGSL